MLTPEATRAGRGLLGWSLQQLAAECGVTYETLSRFENGRPIRDSNALKVAQAFTAHGVELVMGEDRTGAVLVYARRRVGTDG